MSSRQKLRSEETRQAILSAAGKLFAEKGYSHVTMREIAKAAGCSHTAIYIYFKDKESLLHELSIPPLTLLLRQFEGISEQPDLSPKSALIQISMAFVRYGLKHKTMYNTFFFTGASRVDKEPESAINKLRLALFAKMRDQLRLYLELQEDDERLMACSRICFYMLHGIISTYTQSEESDHELLERLGPTFHEAMEALLAGLLARIKAGGER